MYEAIFVGTFVPLLFLAFVLKGENRLLILFFIWGLVAFVLSLRINNALIASFPLGMEKLSINMAPIVEEFAKALPLYFFIGLSKEKKFPLVSFGVAVGIGFSILENYIYLFQHFNDSGSPISFILTRCFTTCLIHATTTGIIGAGIVLVKRIKGIVWPIHFGLFAVAVTIHSLYNLYVFSSYNQIGLYMPVVLFIIGVALYKKLSNKKDEEI